MRLWYLDGLGRVVAWLCCTIRVTSHGHPLHPCIHLLFIPYSIRCPSSLQTLRNLLTEGGLAALFRGVGWRTLNITLTVFIAGEVCANLPKYLLRFTRGDRDGQPDCDVQHAAHDAAFIPGRQDKTS
eukprot:scaffold75491_cov36-Tisochrysis_lutea.AAC.2